ncbi:ATP-binding cassette subfamily B protein [Lacrimispora xylanisolvens]|uniref:ATP-binding cassette subfamily B protein n=1 Tax=Lacrimispora xylanisolvens TaxID=384636 RepID=A0A2S6HPQ2_9FIRM|nr:ABC transporter ATP-binding protein [Hungatella xylanolytica]PPK79563.1 ATP-binding cassette subfamily B protein [Hungatella xylanolytica]
MKKNTGKRLVLYLFGGQKGRMSAVLASILLSTLAALAAPFVLAKAIDHIFMGIQEAAVHGTRFHVNVQTVGSYVGCLMILYLINFILKYVEQYIMSSVSETAGLQMRNDLSRKLGRVPLGFYDATEKGEVLSRTTNDIEKVVEVLREGAGQLITALLTVAGAVIMMLLISPLLTVVSLAVAGAAAILTSWITTRSRNNFSKYQASLGHMNANIEESFTGQLVIKAFGHEKTAIGDFDRINSELCEDSHRAQVSTYIVAPVVRFISSFGYIFIAVMSGLYIIQGKLSIGTVQAFVQYFDRSSEPIIECAHIMNVMQSAVASSERFFEIMDMEEEIPDKAGQEKTENIKGDIDFNHVRFGYQEDSILMQDVNLHLKAGDKVAIVGPTGAGKTTLVNLLMRFYETNGGSITLDGINIKDLNRSELRKQFGMVLQDTWLFGGTIRDNIAYSVLDADKEEIIAAAKAARVDHFIRTMPEGYDTILEEEGSNLSQGQRQLLTIARVILANPPLLILDEATSSVDTLTELEIQKAMDHLMKGRTSFIIAHRLSTIRDADCILVMNQGTIIEQGTHEELLLKKGFYQQLYNSQFADQCG